MSNASVGWCYFATAFCSGVAISSLPFDRSGRSGTWILRKMWAPWVLSGVRNDLEVSGELEALRDEQPRVFVANHQGFLDIPACYASFPFPLPMLAKKELFRVPFLGHFLRSFGYPAIDRAHRDEAFRAFDQAAEIIRGGSSVLVFAEGTRSWDGSIGPFKKGAFILALKAGVPIVPVAIAGSFEAYNRRDRIVRSGLIHVHVGEAISTEGLTLEDRHDLLNRTRDAIVTGFAVATTRRTKALVKHRPRVSALWKRVPAAPGVS